MDSPFYISQHTRCFLKIGFLLCFVSFLTQCSSSSLHEKGSSDGFRRERAAVSSGGKMGELMILDEMLTTGYDRRATPTNHLNYATKVECELFIRSFGSISPSTMDYEVDLYFRQAWLDQRLNHTAIREPLDLSDLNLVKAIWKPEVYFPNAKHGEFQYVTVPNFLVRINPGGYILYQLRLKLTFSCMMELSKFPLDNQICTMEVASFSKTLKELRLEWKLGEAVKLHTELRMPQFEIDKIITSDCQESYQIGNYSCLVAEFHLRRSIGYHLVQSYLPTVLIVSISWVSFWMDVDAVPARTTLGITTLLTVTSKSTSIQGDLPQVSYVKAIDIWMGACTAFVFTALLEFTFVNYMWRKKTIISARKSTHGCENAFNHIHERCYDGQKNAADAEIDFHGGESADRNKTKDEADVSSGDMSYKRMSQRVDEVSRWLFPAVFSLFLLGYWLYYFI